MNFGFLPLVCAGLVAGCSEDLPLPPTPPVIIRQTIIKRVQVPVETVRPKSKAGQTALREFRQEEKAATEARGHPNASSGQIRDINQMELEAYKATQELLDKDGAITPADEEKAKRALDAFRDARSAPTNTAPMPTPGALDDGDLKGDHKPEFQRKYIITPPPVNPAGPGPTGWPSPPPDPTSAPPSKPPPAQSPRTGQGSPSSGGSPDLPRSPLKSPPDPPKQIEPLPGSAAVPELLIPSATASDHPNPAGEQHKATPPPRPPDHH